MNEEGLIALGILLGSIANSIIVYIAICIKEYRDRYKEEGGKK